MYIMNTISVNRSQSRLLDEIKFLIPQYNEFEVVGILQSAISQIKKCKRVKDIERTEDVAFSPKIQSLIGIIPPFSQDEIDSDERLKHILEH